MCTCPIYIHISATIISGVHLELEYITQRAIQLSRPCQPEAGPYMSTAVLIAAVVGGGVLLLMRRLFPRRKAVKLLQYPINTMRGKTVIVTGANCGIGKALAGELLKLRARVVMACRDLRSAEDAAQDLKNRAGPEQGELVIKHLDLASLRSVRTFCEEIKKVTVLLGGR